ncbi:MAG TPA: prefoldin subunit [Candidatus Nanoarchaeia archaeon]|nr:prefoldin subunit [Candidatus Nanoarchaeia archaeon]
MTIKDQKEAQDKISQLQMIEQNVHGFLVQKQGLQTQILEIDNALTELGKTDEAYRIVGSIMVRSKPEELKEDLESKKKMADMRLKSIEKQEEKMKEKAQSLQKDVLALLKEEA